MILFIDTVVYAGKKIDSTLSSEHCLADLFDCSGPRDLLETIFSQERAPSLAEVLAHPWVAMGRKCCREPSIIAKMNEKLDKLRPAGTSAFVAWIPLTECIHVAGQPPPVAIANEIIEHVQVASNLVFAHDGCHTRRVQASKNDDNEEDKEKILYEWCIVERDAGDNDADSFTSSPHEQCTSVRKDSDGNDELSLLSDMKYHAKVNKASLNKFIVSLRVKEELYEDEPSGLWWVRAKWLPATRTRSMGDMLDMFGGPEADLGNSESFVRLQQLLLEGRNVISQRLETRRLRLRQPSKGTLLLPIRAR